MSPISNNSTLKEASFSKMSPWNLLIGAGIQLFEVSTLGQPFEVLKTQMAANRADSLLLSISKTYQRGGIRGFYQGLIPWAWIEASTKGGVLLFTSSILSSILPPDLNPSAKAVLSGMGGGLAQAYTTMGFCTLMKTIEITRLKSPSSVAASCDSTLTIAKKIIQKDGILAMNRGVSAVALRQMTNWGSRFGFSKLTEEFLRSNSNDSSDLSTMKKLSSSVIGGTLGCWNQPIEVIRVEMQRSSNSTTTTTTTTAKGSNASILGTAKSIYSTNGIKGFYRGITPRIGLSIYLTVCMVFGGDRIKAYFGV